MVKTKLFISLYIGFLVYIVLTAFFGSGGLLDYSALAGYKEVLQRNLDQLENIYHDLYSDLKSLTSDAQIVKLYSRDLQYYDKNEYVIKFRGLNTKKISYRVGTILKRKQEEKIETRGYFIGVGFGVFLVVFLFSLAFPNRNKQTYGYKKR